MVDLGCFKFKPVYIDVERDILTPETAQVIEANNEMGFVSCGWKPTSEE